jgi:hypothetical protein
MVRALLIVAAICIPTLLTAQTSRQINVLLSFSGAPSTINSATVFVEFRFGLEKHPDSGIDVREVPLNLAAGRLLNRGDLTVSRFPIEQISYSANDSLVFGCLRSDSETTTYFIPISTFRLLQNEPELDLSLVSNLQEFYDRSIDTVMPRRISSSSAFATLRGLDALVGSLVSFVTNPDLAGVSDGDGSAPALQGTDICRIASRESLRLVFNQFSRDLRTLMFENISYLDEADSEFVFELLDQLESHDELIDQPTYTELHAQFLNRVLGGTANRNVINVPLHQRISERLTRIYSNRISRAWPFANETLAALVSLGRTDDCINLSSVVLEALGNMRELDASAPQNYGTLAENYRQSLIESTRCVALLAREAGRSGADVNENAEILVDHPNGSRLLSAFVSAFQNAEERNLLDRDQSREITSGLTFYIATFEARG